MSGSRLSSLPSPTASAAFLIGLVLAPSLLAQIHVEVNAGDLPATAENLSAGPVTAIAGALTHPLAGFDRDMYVFHTPGGAFSATVTAPISGGDSQLFLFDATGRGLFANDDYLAAFPSGPSRISATLAPGQYFLAISSFDDDPVSLLGMIFPTFPDDFLLQVGPTGPGGSQPIIGWNNLGGDGFSYEIALINAFGAPPTGGDETGSGVPDTGSSLALLSIGILTLMTMRRQIRL
jgi:hypothetical protein